MVKRIVCDTSIAVAWLLGDEQDTTADAVLAAVEKGASLAVPDLWFYEVGNTLNVCQSRGRLSAGEKDEAVRLLSHLPLERFQVASADQLNPLMATAQRHGLSVYDASYLMLAVKEALPLATLDKALLTAANKESVTLFQP